VRRSTACWLTVETKRVVRWTKSKQISNASYVLRALKAGIWTETTKSELERLESEKARLVARQITHPASLSVEEILPRLEARFSAAVENLAQFPAGRVAEARRSVLLLLGGQPIILNPTDDGGLEAEMIGDYAGLMRITGDEKLNNCGCGERI
jgi:hypothetical protein